jgi:serine/threonine protein kinase
VKIANRYELIEEIGHGGMSNVYLGLDCESGEIVAVKISKDLNEKDNHRFNHEKEILKKANYHSIVKYKDSGFENDKPFIVMEYVSGHSIGDTPLSKEELLKLFIKICNALDYLQSLNVIHRDIKPSNIIISNENPVIVDFGISHEISKTRVTVTGSIIGTISYMSPEQVSGQEMDNTVDLYALGTVMYELLTGEPVFTGNNVAEIIYKIITEKPKKPIEIDNTIPKSLDSVIMRLLDKNPKQRYSTGSEVALDLQKILDGEEIIENVISSITSEYVPFIGREDILEEFNKAIERAIKGIPTYLNIYRPSGIGKTRLLEEFRSQGIAKNAKFLLCDPSLAKPSKPAISSILDQLSDYELEIDKNLLTKYAYQLFDLSEKFAFSTDLAPQQTPSQSSNFHEVVAYIISQAQRNNLVILAFEEELDKFTLDVLDSLPKYSASSKTIIITLSQLAKNIKSNSIINCEKHELKPFFPSDVQKISKSVLKKEISNQEIAIIMDKTGGNPFFTISLLKQMRDKGSSLSLSKLPEDVAEIYQSIFSKLSAQSQRAIMKMSLIGCAIPLKKLNIMLGMLPIKVKQFLDEIKTTNIIIDRIVGDDSCIEIISKLVAEVFEDSISENEKKTLNLEIARSYELSETNPSNETKMRMSKHLLDSGNIEKGVMGIIDCSSALSKEFKFDYILKYLDNLDERVEGLGNKNILLDFYIKKIHPLGARGRFSDAEKYVPKMEVFFDDTEIPLSKKLDLSITLSNHYSGSGNVKTAGKYAKIGYALLDDSATPEQASKINHFMAVGIVEDGNIEEAQIYANDELMYALIGGNKSMIEKAYLIISYIKLRQGEFELAIQDNMESIRLAQEMEDDDSLLQSLNNLAEIYFTKGDIDTAIQTLEQMRTKAIEIFNYRQFGFASTNLIYALLSSGKLKESKQICKQSLDEFKFTGSMFLASSPYCSLLSFYYFENNNQNFDDLSKEIIELAKLHNNKACEFHTKLLGSKHQIAIGNLKDAMDILKEIESLASDDDRKIQLCTTKSKVLTLNGEFIKARETLNGTDKFDIKGDTIKSIEVFTAWLKYFYLASKNFISKKDDFSLSKMIENNGMGFDRFMDVMENTKKILGELIQESPSIDFYLPEIVVSYANCLTLLESKDRRRLFDIDDILIHTKKYMDTFGFELYRYQFVQIYEEFILNPKIA